MRVSTRYTECQSANQRQRALSLTWLLVLAVCGCVVPAPAFAADAASLGDLVCNVKNNGLSIYPRILTAISYIVGSFLIVRSFLLLKKHADNPSSSQVVPASAQMIGGGFMLALPVAVQTVQKTFFASFSGSKSFACQAGSIGSGATSLDVMMQNFVRNLYSPMFTLIAFIGLAAGLTMIYQGLARAAKTGTDPRASAPKDIIANLVFGAILVSASTILPDTLQTLFGSGTVSKMTDISIIKWSALGETGSTENADKTVRAILAFVQIIGAIAFVRGWMLMKKTIEGGQPGMPTCLTHIVAGAMAINIDKMLKILNNTFGVDVIV